jgi:plastocyanin
MPSRFFILIIALALLIPLGCTTTRGKAPKITEEPPAPQEEVIKPAEKEPPVKEPVMEEEKPAVQEEAPPVETEAPKPQEATPPAEEKAKTTPLPGGGTLHQVTIFENTLKLTPPNITIHVGDTIRWENKDNKKHFLASVPGSGKTDKLEIFSLMPPGFVFEHTFTTAGIYPYFCFIHNQMRGEITVVE